MLSNIKTYLTIISILIAVLTSGYSFFMKVHSDMLKDERNNAYDELEVKTQETIKYKNKINQEVTRVIEYKKTLEQLRNSNDSIEKRLYETISASNLKDKQLKKAIQIEIEASNKSTYDSVVMMEKTSTVNAAYKMQPVDIAPIKYNEIRYFDDGFLNAVSYPDSLVYTYKEDISVVTAKRLIERKFFLWRWFGWKKMVDRDLLEIVSSNPKSTLNGRMVKIDN